MGVQVPLSAPTSFSNSEPANPPPNPHPPKIDQCIAELGDWLAKLRRILHAADPDIIEEWKWMGTPVWSHAGIVCTWATYKDHVKMTFARRAALPDPARLL